MKGIFILIFSLTGVLLFAPNEQSTCILPEIEDIFICESTEHPFASGEKLTYSIYYNLNFIWIQAGQVEFHIIDKGDHYHARSVGTTVGSFEWFVKVHDVYECTMTKDQLKPMHTVRDIQEGNYTKYTEGNYNHTDNKVYVEATDRHGKTNNRTYDIESCAQDILSLAYQARAIDYGTMKVGQKFRARMILDDDPVYNIQFTYDGIEQIKVKKLGKAECTRLSPSLFSNGVFNEQDKMNIWVSNDRNRIPLLLETAISVGSIKVVLKSYERLKYPLESVVE